MKKQKNEISFEMTTATASKCVWMGGNEADVNKGDSNNESQAHKKKTATTKQIEHKQKKAKSLISVTHSFLLQQP